MNAMAQATCHVSSCHRATLAHACEPQTPSRSAAACAPSRQAAAATQLRSTISGRSLSSQAKAAAASPSTRAGVARSSPPVVAAAGPSEGLPSLNDLPINSYINGQGRIVPPIDPGTAATVFAVLDKNKKVQYVGFSKDIRNTLRTLMGRRPEFCYFYKLHHLKEVDQQKMLNIRGHWFSEMGLAPVGNTDAVQRAMWEKPVDAGSISERGKAAAGQSKAKTLLQMMVDRGLQEEMVYDPALLEQGLCDVVASKELSQEEVAAAAEADKEAAAKRLQVKERSPSGEEVEFEILFDNKMKTNGGWMYDIYITKDDKETRHRVVVGRMFPEAAQMHEDDFVARAFAFLLHKKIPRHTEGVLSSEQFGINYFSISEVVQKFDDFRPWFASELPDSYWRFNRLHSYGNEKSPVQTSLAPEIYTPQY